MFKLTKKIEYALIALQHMQTKNRSNITSVKEIADRYDLPLSLLAKILQQLAKHKIVKPMQGPNGGYQIINPLDKIMFKDLVEIIERPIGIVDCLKKPDCSHIGDCNIQVPIERINAKINKLFSTMTVADITN